jgi:hypothetical protein
MNFAKVENSPRLQRVLGVLHGGEWASTMDIVRRASVCAVNSAISELRRNGYEVACRMVKKDGETHFEYRMEP